jgi:hypothetical protein
MVWSLRVDWKLVAGSANIKAEGSGETVAET